MNAKCKKVHEQLEQLETVTCDMALVASAIMVLSNVENKTETFFDTSIKNDADISIGDVIIKLKSMGNNMMLSQCDLNNSITYMR